MTLTYGYATSDDVRAFYDNAEMPTIKAVCVKRDGVPVGISGLRLMDKHAIFFMDHRMTPKELSSITAWRGVKLAMGLVKKCAVPVISIASCLDGHMNLQKLGFIHAKDDVYRWASWHS